MNGEALISKLRSNFHRSLLDSVLKLNNKGVPSNADSGSKPSIRIACGILEQLKSEGTGDRLAGQTSGSEFENLCVEYIKESFLKLGHLRPGSWTIEKGSGSRSAISSYDQYDHLDELDSAARSNPQLAAALGSDYLIKPDIVISRSPVEDDFINRLYKTVDLEFSRHTPLRSINNNKPILHASVSCKWTLRSDRAQNARSEGLNLVRNRKGRLPHIMVVTGEPTPGRIASIALGTGDVDCVYHFALNELRSALEDLGEESALELLDTMVQGKRLRDISDLPLDLTI